MPLRTIVITVFFLFFISTARGDEPNPPPTQAEGEETLTTYPQPPDDYAGSITVKEIRVRGNTYSDTSTIINYMTIDVGEVFADQGGLESAVDKSLRRLMDTQLFSLIQVYDLPRSDPSQAVIYVLIREGEHWSIGGDFWYGTLGRKNLFGTGKEVGITLGFNRLGAYYHDPYLFNTPLTYSLSLHHYRGSRYSLEPDDGENVVEGASFSLNRTIARFDFGLHLSDDLTLVARFSAEHYYPYNQSEGFDFAPFSADTVHNNNTLGASLTLDLRDTNWNPNSGALLLANYERGFPRLGGDFSYEKYGLDARFYLPIPVSRHTIIASRLYIQRAEGETPYFLLPNIGGLGGLRAPNYGHYTAPTALLASLELRQRLFSLPLFGVWFEGAFFVDVGRAFEEGEKFEVSELLWAVGPSLRLHMFAFGRHSARLDVGFGREGYELYLTWDHAF